MLGNWSLPLDLTAQRHLGDLNPRRWLPPGHHPRPLSPRRRRAAAAAAAAAVQDPATDRDGRLGFCNIHDQVNSPVSRTALALIPPALFELVFVDIFLVPADVVPRACYQRSTCCITVPVDPYQDAVSVATVLAHELGHAYDDQRLSAPRRAMITHRFAVPVWHGWFTAGAGAERFADAFAEEILSPQCRAHRGYRRAPRAWRDVVRAELAHIPGVLVPRPISLVTP